MVEKIFCSYGCGNEAMFFIGKLKKPCCSKSCNSCSELKKKNSEALKNKYKDETYLENRKDIYKDKSAWNKGLTQESSEKVKQYAETLKRNYADGTLVSKNVGVTLSAEHKEKISNGMKNAHKENRAWNIGQSRWNNKPSYPEQFFMKVIENEFVNKNYIREYPFRRYSLDFAWESLKKVIEIDGDQHERFPEYQERDLRKDEALLSEGWQILRIRWKDMFNNTQEYIKIAKEFIDI